MTTHYSGPIFSEGGFVGGNGFGGAPGGKVFYVNASSGGADDVDVPWWDPGETEGKVFSTLQAAIDACVANRGDVIYVKRSETVTSTVTFNKTGISVIGQGFGMNPLARGEYHALLADATFTDGPVATITSGCFIYGLGFASRDTGATFYDGAAMLLGGLGTAAPFGVHLHSCRFPKWNLDNRIGVAIEGGSDILIEHCSFEGVGADFDSGVYVQGAVQNLCIRHNHFRDCTYAITHGAFVGGGPHCIYGPWNVCEDSKFLETGSNAATGMIVGNFMEGATDTGSYDVTVNAANALGLVFSGNTYAE